MNCPDEAAEVVVAGETLWLLPERAVYWPRRRWLWMADLHWGKDATYRAAGIPLPSGGLAADLARLETLVTTFQPERVLILGDLIHARASLHRDVVETVAAWRERFSAPWVLLDGNHDRHVPHLPDEWKIERAGPSSADGPFVFQHRPEPDPRGFVWAGHVHPVVVLGRGKERWRLPCFHLGAAVGILPAFGNFTGGARVRDPGVSYAICDGAVRIVPA